MVVPGSIERSFPARGVSIIVVSCFLGGSAGFLLRRRPALTSIDPRRYEAHTEPPGSPHDGGDPRLTGDVARRDKLMLGRVPLHTIRADVDFAVSEARTVMGRIGVRVYIYRGDVLPQPGRLEDLEEEMLPIEVTVRPDEEEPADAATEES